MVGGLSENDSIRYRLLNGYTRLKEACLEVGRNKVYLNRHVGNIECDRFPRCRQLRLLRSRSNKISATPFRGQRHRHCP